MFSKEFLISLPHNVKEMSDSTKRQSKEYKFTDDNKFTVKYGTLNKLNSNVIYIKSKMKLTPSMITKGSTIEGITKKFSQCVSEYVNKNHSIHNTHICQLDINENKFRNKKNTYLKYDLFIKPLNQDTIENFDVVVKDITGSINKKIKEILAEKD